MNAMLQELERDRNTTRPNWAMRDIMAPTEVGSLDQIADTLYFVVAGEPLNTTLIHDFTLDRSPLLTELFPWEEEREDPSSREDKLREERENKLHAELFSYKDLPHGWDGKESLPPSPEALTDAISFLAKKPDDIPLPYPQIGSDGEVGLYWRTDEVFAEVGFYGNGEYSYFARYSVAGATVDEQGEDDRSLDNDQWAEGLLRILNKIDR